MAKIQTQIMGNQRKGLKMVKNPFWSMGLWYVKNDPSQNQDLSTSLERSHKELLNELISLEIRHYELKLWTVKERASKWQKFPLEHGL